MPKKAYPKLSRGFTLIELLVVLGILGILAAALLVAIDPIEQIKKSEDASVQSTSQEFDKAAVSYYASHNAFPWDAAVDGGANCYSGGNTFSKVTLNSFTNCIQSLIADGDLKQSFMNTNNLSQVAISYINNNQQTGNPTEIIVCYAPESADQQREANTDYNQDGTLGSKCLSQGGTQACYWCTSGTNQSGISPTPAQQGSPALSNEITSTPTPTPTPTQSTKGMHVEGNLLKYPDGSRMVAKGAVLYIFSSSTAYSLNEWNHEYPLRDQIFAKMQQLGINSVRISLNGDSTIWNMVGGESAYIARMADLVSSANAHGITVMFCWWNSNFDKSNWPTTYTNYFPLMDAFYAKFATNPMVFYEPWNEPNQITDTQWMDTMKATISHWRGLGYKGVLVIDTNNYSSTFNSSYADQLLSYDTSLNGLGKPNIMFANHRYANNNTCFCGIEKSTWDSTVGNYVGTYPILGTEYGFNNGNQWLNDPQWDIDFLTYLSGTKVAQGFNGAYIFSWNWGSNSLTNTDFLTLSSQGNIANNYFWSHLTSYK